MICFKDFILRTGITFFSLVAMISSISSQYSSDTSTGAGPDSFHWPEGIKMAVSLSFDDARVSQADNGIPLFDKYGVRATFYVHTENRIKERLDIWKKAASAGHEIGNHSLRHSCSGNFVWSRPRALENYTIDQMAREIDSASNIIERLTGVRPETFCYPCGQKYIGRGESVKSYVPLIADRFYAGRGWRDEAPNDPVFCDLAQIYGMQCDGFNFDFIKRLLDRTRDIGGWLVLAGHEITKSPPEEGKLETSTLMLEELCRYATDPKNGIWIAPVRDIAKYIADNRPVIKKEELPLYKNSNADIEIRVNDLLGRMTLKEKIGQINMPCVYQKGLEESVRTEEIDLSEGTVYNADMDVLKKMTALKKFTEGTFSEIGPGGGFFTCANTILQKGARQQANFFNDLQKIAIEKTRLGIPLIQTEEGTHGLMCSGSTIFPEGLALGSTWNMDLVEKVYSAAAKEARSTGIHQLFTLVIEPNRDPRMGRNEEAYSEDTYLTSRIAEAIVKGCQGDGISAGDKVVAGLCHYPGQSQAVSGLEFGDMEMSERVLREVFLPPWEAGIKKSGALGVMATHPTFDGLEGLPAHASEKLLTDILRGELDFRGIVLGEGNSVRTILWKKVAETQQEAGIMAINAGLDVSISLEPGYMEDMIEAVNSGKLSEDIVDRAVERVLYQKFRLGLFENPYVDPEKAARIRHSEVHQELALQAAREGIVLLKNEKNLLPLKKDIRSIAVIGPNAHDKLSQLGDYHPRTVLQDVVTVLDGISKKVPAKTRIEYVKGCDILGDGTNEIRQACSAAKRSDIAVIVVGESGQTVGEKRDVASLDLTGMQEELIKAVYATGTPVVVVLINGRPLSIRWTSENVPAIIEAWNCGEKGGDAVADILFGDYNPSGRLAITIPRHSGQLPVYYNYKPSKEMRMKPGYADMSAYPLYDFGFGMSYTTFEYSGLSVSPAQTGPAGKIEVSFDVKNTGLLPGTEVAQLYIDDVISSVTTPVMDLRGFEKIYLNPGEKKTVKFILGPSHLVFLDRHLEPVVEKGTFNVMAGRSSGDIKLRGSFEIK